MRSYLAVTRGGTLTDLKALFDATKDSTDGIGSTDDGALNAIDQRLDASTTIVGDPDDLWPTGEAAPYAWVVAPEESGDLDLYRIDGTEPTVLSDSLLIDGVLYQAARLQVTSDRPGFRAGNLVVRATRERRIVDASSRTVELPTPAKARVERSRTPSEVARLGTSLGERNRAARVVVKLGNAWRNITVGALLDGLIDDPDILVRRAFSVAGTAGTLPTITVTQIEAANAATGLANGVAVPAITVPQDGGAFVVVVLPRDSAFTYFDIGGANTGVNSRHIFAVEPNDVLTLNDGSVVDVYISETNPVLASFALNAYFDRDSADPA